MSVHPNRMLGELSLTEWHDSITQKINEYGHQLIGVFGTKDDPSPSFTYTIGLSITHGFELIVLGVPNQIGAAILNKICAELRAGNQIQISVPDDRWANLPCKFEPAHPVKVGGYVAQADRYFDKAVPFIQLVVPDKNGLFPEDLQYDHEYMDPRQPVLY